jgi:colanic acid/amylovoran biosynthesis glycosyltransferase
MRVGYVLKRYPRYSETFIVTEILAQEAAGLEIEIFSLRPPEDSHFQDAIARVRAPVHYLPAEGLKVSEFWMLLEHASQVFPGMWAALEFARGHNAREISQAIWLANQVHLKGLDLLHAHFATSATSVARLAGLFSGVPYTFTAHAKDIFHQGVQYEDLRRKLSDAAAVIAVSEFNAEYLRKMFGIAAERVQHIYNGLEIDRFPFSAPYDRLPVIVAVGRLVEKKGFADLIDACRLLSRRGCQFTCQIIGNGELQADLQEQIDRLRLQDRIELLGPRPQIEVVQRIGRAAMLAAPCVVGSDGNRDGLPTVLLEAMSLGTPCISTDVTGIPEVIRDGETGLRVPQQDPVALASAIERLLVNADLRVHLAHHARSLIEDKFDISRNAARLRELFHSVANAVVPMAKGVW